MARDKATVKERNRRVKQEALREMLSKKCTIEQVVDLVNKIGNEEREIDSNMLARYRVVLDTKLKLINKYLPELKSVEVVDEDGNDALPKSITINVVPPSTDT